MPGPAELCPKVHDAGDGSAPSFAARGRRLLACRPGRLALAFLECLGAELDRADVDQRFELVSRIALAALVEQITLGLGVRIGPDVHDPRERAFDLLAVLERDLVGVLAGRIGTAREVLLVAGVFLEPPLLLDPFLLVRAVDPLDRLEGDLPVLLLLLVEDLEPGVAGQYDLAEMDLAVGHLHETRHGIITLLIFAVGPRAKRIERRRFRLLAPGRRERQQNEKLGEQEPAERRAGRRQHRRASWSTDGGQRTPWEPQLWGRELPIRGIRSHEV